MNGVYLIFYGGLTSFKLIIHMENIMSKNKECSFEEHIESLFGPTIDFERVKVVVATATHTIQKGSITSRRTDVALEQGIGGGNSPSSICSTNDILEVSGKARTGSEGTIEFELSSFLCREGFPRGFEDPAIIVVTPLATSPVFSTARAFIVSEGSNVTIKVETWGTDGNPASNQSFNWYCRVPISNPLPPQID